MDTYEIHTVAGTHVLIGVHNGKAAISFYPSASAEGNPNDDKLLSSIIAANAIFIEDYSRKEGVLIVELTADYEVLGEGLPYLEPKPFMELL